MLHKEVTRKQFLLSILSLVGIFALSKIPGIGSNNSTKKIGTTTTPANTYGNHSYGGKKL